MKKIAQFIVEKRLLLFLLFIGLIVYCAFGVSKVSVEYSITEYLPDGTDTKKALKIMEEEFAEFGSATVMVRGIESDKAVELGEKLAAVDGVTNLTFDANDESNYKKGNALYTVFFASAKDKSSIAAYNNVLKILDNSGYKYGVPTPLVNDYADTLASEMVVIIAIAAAVIIAVLLFTSKSFAEVLAFPVVFGVAALLNMGTNYWLGTISFVSNTVCIILQLALAIDYAIILCHRFTEEKDKNPTDAKAALISALAKAIPEIASSSLTTVSGLVALMFMQLGLGFDLGMVLAKSIICSLLTVFLLMPCLLLWLTKLMDKSRHKSFVPKVTYLGVGVIKVRYALLAVFAVLFGVCAWLAQTVTFCYSTDTIDTSRPTATMSAQRDMARVFGESNMFVILLPADTDFEVQREVAATVQAEPLIKSALGWATIALPSQTDSQKSYYLTDKITYADLSDITGIDKSVTALLFMRYAITHGGYGGVGLADYSVTASDLFDYVFSDPQISQAAGNLASYKTVLEFGKQQLIGKNHYRLVFDMGSSVESEKTFALIERLTPAVKKIAPKAIFAGAGMSAYDLNGSFKTDNLLITLLTTVFVFLILAITFRSWGIPIVLVAVIQGAIFINFTIPVIVGKNLFFFVYLIASAIQMGATIDYAILMTNRFRQFSQNRSRRDAVINAINAAFPTVLTSGTIMTVAAFLVGFMTSDPLISSMGITLGLGTVISIVCVLTVLPALLYVLAPLLEKTVLKRKLKAKDIRLPNPSKRPNE